MSSKRIGLHDGSGDAAFRGLLQCEVLVHGVEIGEYGGLDNAGAGAFSLHAALAEFDGDVGFAEGFFAGGGCANLEGFKLSGEA